MRHDSFITRAVIHPGIGVARIGDAESEFFIGPEVVDPAPLPLGSYRDAADKLKRQAARFRIYGLNAAGEVVAELTAQTAEITWTVELANRKAQWYRFITAMDIPEAADLSVPRRNPEVTGQAREHLAIAPGPRSIAGPDQAGVAFDTGSFTCCGITKGNIYLGELRTDDAGRLLVLGGRGVSESVIGAPPMNPKDPGSFNNADSWFDDTSDGTVDAAVTIDGRAIPVEGAWVVVTPPNYAPEVIGWRTMHDLLTDVQTAAGNLPLPEVTSFSRDVLPQLQRLSNLQWVNKGFAAMFGKGAPMDFEDPDFIARLGQAPEPSGDPYRELRQQILNTFRPPESAVNEPRIWPWIYGDDFAGDLFAASPRTMLGLPSLQAYHLKNWVAGTFVPDYTPDAHPPRDLSQVPLADQPAMLDRAALHFCLADAFHPGCELTWPMRHATLYAAPGRIRRDRTTGPRGDFGTQMSAQDALGLSGPLHAQRPGDLTRWMGLPWQGDTAYCRAGYDPDYDPYLPTFWPARVPNQVLTEADYQIVMDQAKPLEVRLAAYHRRASWYRFIDKASDPADNQVAVRMERMIHIFGQQGIVETRPGPADDPVFPARLHVETLAAAHKQTAAVMASELLSVSRADAPAPSRLDGSVWDSETHLQQAIAMRRRGQ